jgi:hypothetical protein
MNQLRARGNSVGLKPSASDYAVIMWLSGIVNILESERSSASAVLDSP